MDLADLNDTDEFIAVNLARTLCDLAGDGDADTLSAQALARMDAPTLLLAFADRYRALVMQHAAATGRTVQEVYDRVLAEIAYMAEPREEDAFDALLAEGLAARKAEVAAAGDESAWRAAWEVRRAAEVEAAGGEEQWELQQYVASSPERETYIAQWICEHGRGTSAGTPTNKGDSA